MSIWRHPESRFLLLLITSIAIVAKAENGPLHVCGPSSTSDSSSRSLVFVSTLDGKLSVLDLANNGEMKWTLDFGEGPMLSSNIHRRELNNDGHWVRLIPSLNGGLYKFDGDNLEAVPLSTDQLLRSSFRYSDDLVFSGGKETRSYGVSTRTGQILYKCNISGCTNNTEGDAFVEQEVLVVQRFQQTVRAVEPRTGLEKWNFSVGQHDLVLIPRENADCNGKASIIARDIELRVIVPEGLVWAVNKSNPRIKLWQHKFDSPIVSIWREDGTSGKNDIDNTLEEVDLFDGSQWTWGSEFSTSPGVYVGMHDRQLYVQENADITKMIEHSSHKTTGYMKLPWRPYPAVENAVAITREQNSRDEENGNDVSSREIMEASSTTALSVLYNSEYVNGNGFYLYTKEQYERSNQCNSTNPNIIIIDNVSQPSNVDYANEEDDTPVQVIIVSLWYWWKEVSMISTVTALILNFMLTNNMQRLINALTVVKDAVHPPVIVETHVETKQEDRKTLLDSESVNDFKSRYLTDFDPIDCLGKGGYGVVFEAKNKIDDCNYAIKRIALPNSQDSRDRVMREVRALAKLDHHNIVRYFNAWLECPPAGWREEHDEKYINNQKLSPSEFASEYSQSATKPNGSVCIDVPHSSQSSLDSAFEAVELNNPCMKSDDSYIVFEGSNTGEESAITEEIASFSRDESSEISKDSGAKTDLITENTEDSECIVFRNSESRSVDKKEMSKRKASFSLKLNNKDTAKKTAKMFLYIQMQLCRKFSLKEWLKRQSQARDLPRIVNIFQQIVDAVHYVHFQGLIHRDLKPSNIFFAYDDKIKIGDFGLVTAMTEGLDEEDVHTPDGETDPGPLKDRVHTARVGTRLYMSPEQMNGQIYNYKVDIYSLGIIFFELLIPFLTDMERVATLLNLRNSKFPDGFAEQHPKAYELLKIMLDKNPGKRPTTLGIKARPPLSDNATSADLTGNEDRKWHFELPQLSRHSSATSSSTSSESWEKSVS